MYKIGDYIYSPDDDRFDYRSYNKIAEHGQEYIVVENGCHWSVRELKNGTYFIIPKELMESEIGQIMYV